MVLLQGCRTDVKSTFEGDPVEYVLHVIQETRVRDDQFERLLAELRPLLDGVPPADLNSDDIAFLVGESGLERERVFTLNRVERNGVRPG